MQRCCNVDTQTPITDWLERRMTGIPLLKNLHRRGAKTVQYMKRTGCLISTLKSKMLISMESLLCYGLHMPDYKIVVGEIMNLHPCTAIKSNFRKKFNERTCFPSTSHSGISQVYSLNLSRLKNTTLIPCKKHIFFILLINR